MLNDDELRDIYDRFGHIFPIDKLIAHIYEQFTLQNQINDLTDIIEHQKLNLLNAQEEIADLRTQISEMKDP
jgi:cell division protein FtsL